MGTKKITPHGDSSRELLRLPKVLSLRGVAKSQLYRDIANGLMTPGIRRSQKSVAWPAYEVEVINRADIAGLPVNARKALVARMLQVRKQQMTTETDQLTQMITSHASAAQTGATHP